MILKCFARYGEELSIVFLQGLSNARQTFWSITMGNDGVAVGNFGTLNAYQDGPGRFITGLLPGRLNKDYPIGKVPCKANT